MALQRILTPPQRGFDSLPTHVWVVERASCADGDPDIRSPRETAKQVKCCGDTPVRHTGVGGFNSPLLLDPIVRARFLVAATTGVREARTVAATTTWSRRHPRSNAGLADGLGTGLPPRSNRFDSDGPLFSTSNATSPTRNNATSGSRVRIPPDPRMWVCSSAVEHEAKKSRLVHSDVKDFSPPSSIAGCASPP